MKLISQEQAVARQNSPQCTVFEYEFDDSKELNCAVVELEGRYPETGYSLNSRCDEQVYVMVGSGSLILQDGRIEQLAQGDMVAIKAGEGYCFDGQMRLLIASNPAWHVDQYTVIQD